MRAGERKNRGAAVIEFAILLPLLAIILFGILEFGFIWLQSHYIANAAREGARIAAKLAEVDDEDGSGQPYVQVGVRDYLRGLFLYKDLNNNEIDIDFFTTCSDAHVPALPVSPTLVAIVVEEDSLANCGGTNTLDPQPEAVRVKVKISTRGVWNPILWILMDKDDPHEGIPESAVFAREN